MGSTARLTEDATLNPDTMDERCGSWGRLLALFRMIHGHRTGFVQARGGKLFDPDDFPFLEGRAAKADAPRRAPAAAPPPLVARPAERRQLTVMFVDLVGSTALS